LLRRGNRPWSRYAAAVEESGSALAVLEEERDRGELDMQANLLSDHDPVGTIIDEIDEWKRAGFELLTVLDEGFPLNLRAVHDRPPLIFVAGALSPEDDRSVAVVGARRSSPDGESAAREIAESLVEAQFVVVSG